MRFFIFILGSVISIALQAQKVENTSFVSTSGEKFGTGSDWDKTYNFFVKGNIWTYEQILKLY